LFKQAAPPPAPAGEAAFVAKESGEADDTDLFSFDAPPAPAPAPAANDFGAFAAAPFAGGDDFGDFSMAPAAAAPSNDFGDFSPPPAVAPPAAAENTDNGGSMFSGIDIKQPQSPDGGGLFGDLSVKASVQQPAQSALPQTTAKMDGGGSSGSIMFGDVQTKASESADLQRGARGSGGAPAPAANDFGAFAAAPSAGGDDFGGFSVAPAGAAPSNDLGDFSSAPAPAPATFDPFTKLKKKELPDKVVLIVSLPEWLQAGNVELELEQGANVVLCLRLVSSSLRTTLAVRRVKLPGRLKVDSIEAEATEDGHLEITIPRIKPLKGAAAAAVSACSQTIYLTYYRLFVICEVLPASPPVSLFLLSPLLLSFLSVRTCTCARRSQVARSLQL
jgi:HSP20 family molecular chaperone IbpA